MRVLWIGGDNCLEHKRLSHRVEGNRRGTSGRGMIAAERRSLVVVGQILRTIRRHRFPAHSPSRFPRDFLLNFLQRNQNHPTNRRGRQKCSTWYQDRKRQDEKEFTRKHNRENPWGIIPTEYAGIRKKCKAQKMSNSENPRNGLGY